MIQKENEFEAYLNLVRCLRPQVVLEIGVAQGGSLARVAGVAPDTALLIGVDLGRPATIPCRPGQTLRLIEGNSHGPQVYDQVLDVLDGRAVDLLFIDGDHHGALQDFTDFGKLVRIGGMIAFHDIVPGPARDVGMVPEAWKVLKLDRPHAEIVERWDQGGYGIGVIWR